MLVSNLGGLESLLQNALLARPDELPPRSQPRSIAPSYFIPHGHADTWICPFDGCNCRIWGATSVMSIAKIEAHYFRDHQNGTLEYLDPSTVSTYSSGYGATKRRREPQLPGSRSKRAVLRKY